MAGGRVCGAGAAVERSGAVWSDCVLGKPADAGDWSEDGAGSAAWVGVPDGFEGGELVDCGGGGGGGGGVQGRGCSIGVGMMMRALLFGVHAWDAPTLAGVAIVLGVFALIASY